jgi:tetratricopeptide (TPR) repeat protein
MSLWRLLACLCAAAVTAAAPVIAQEPARTLETSKPSTVAPAEKPVSPPAAAARPTAAETISLSADTSKGYARLTFKWGSPVRYQASVSDGVLIVTFARPFRLPPDQSSLQTSGYVSLIRQDADGRTLRLSLSRKVRLHTSAAGPFVAIDLVPPSFAGDPDDVVDPTVKPKRPGGVVDVSLAIGVHSDKTRLAFDWGENVAYKAEVADGKISVAFEREGKIDVRRLNDNPPAWVKAARVSAGDNKTLLEIDIDPGSPVEDSRFKTKIVLDIRAPVNDSDAEIAIVVPDEMQPTAKPEVDAEPAAKGHDATADTGSKSGHGDEGHGKSETSAADHPPPPKAEEPKSDPQDAGAAKDAHAEDTHAKTGEQEPKEHKAADHTSDPGPLPKLKVTREKGQIAITLPARQDQAAAIFRRGPTVFVVLDGAGPVDPDALQKSASDVVSAPSVSTKDGITILTFTLLKQQSLSAVVRDNAWTAILAADSMPPPRPVALMRDVRQAGSTRMRATLERATQAVELADPVTAESIIAVLANGEPQALLGARTYVDFAADATAQGLSVRPFVDDLMVLPGADDVIIERPGGLTLSAGTVSDYSPDRSSLGDAARPAAMDFQAWEGEGSFLEERSRLMKSIPDDKAAAEMARLDVARFYLARDLGAEALGQLQLIAQDDPGVTGDPAFRAMRGAALLLLGRHKEAQGDLDAPSLEDDPSARLFRGLAAAGLQQWGAARDAITSGEEAISAFRPDWQARFRIAGAWGAMETNAVDVAERMLGAIPPKGVSSSQLIEADLIRGLLAHKLRREEDALKLIGRVKNSADRPLAARAALADIELRSETGAMQVGEAIESLEKLRWQWRGDHIELATLHRLGTLQIEKGDYRSGLATLRSAVMGFPGKDLSRQISGEMAALFEELFLRGKADALPPVQALGLYYDFKELTPIGASGDDMVRRLADRLIGVDLLEQAAELLQHQVDKRLDGVARAQISARLAAVYLMDRKPEKALATLRATMQTRLPDDLASQRRLLSARALSDLKQYDAALESFDQDETPDALRLRADILWAASRWPDVAKAVETLIKDREKDQRALDGGERTDVLRAAIAYTMADDNAGLSSLRDRFVVLMAETPEAAAFEMVTRSADPTNVAFRDLAKAVAGIDTLDRFLQSLGLGRPADGTAQN